MIERGYEGFHQTTIYKIEIGERKVEVHEAFELADIVGEALDLMMDHSPESLSRRKRRVEHAGHDFIAALREALPTVQRAVLRRRAFEEAMSDLDRAVRDDRVESPYPGSQTARDHFDPLLQFLEASVYERELAAFLDKDAVRNLADELGLAVEPMKRV